jgi:hypothetical protein
MIQRRASRLTVLLAFIGLLVLGACGASSRLKVIRANVVALNAAGDVVLALSKEREKQLYDSCNPPTCTKEEGHARVEAWQKKVNVVMDAINRGYQAQHDAALLDDAKSAAHATAAAAKALDLYKQLKETP